jgi:hypothetical protein
MKKKKSFFRRFLSLDMQKGDTIAIMTDRSSSGCLGDEVLMAHSYPNLYCNSIVCPIRASAKSENKRDLIEAYKSVRLGKCEECESVFYCSKVRMCILAS